MSVVLPVGIARQGAGGALLLFVDADVEEAAPHGGRETTPADHQHAPASLNDPENAGRTSAADAALSLRGGQKDSRACPSPTWPNFGHTCGG
jgi:hypothetical protein